MHMLWDKVRRCLAPLLPHLAWQQPAPQDPRTLTNFRKAAEAFLDTLRAQAIAAKAAERRQRMKQQLSHEIAGKGIYKLLRKPCRAPDVKTKTRDGYITTNTTEVLEQAHADWSEYFLR